MSASINVIFTNKNANLIKVDRNERYEKCPFFSKCTAPLCPEDSELKNRIWFPDEEICHTHSDDLFVLNQRKIQRKILSRDTYFTFEMLNKSMEINQYTRGKSFHRKYIFRIKTKYIVSFDKNIFEYIKEVEKLKNLKNKKQFTLLEVLK